MTGPSTGTPAIGTDQRPLRVAIIGSGPSAFYAAEALFKAAKLFPDAALPGAGDARGLRVQVDMFERLPTPYGLVRGGVAPDHQKIKAVARVYEQIAASDDFRFFGNVMLGRDLGVADLDARYDQVVLAVGAESDRRLGIPGEDLPGVHSATAFVGWYNGHPDHCEHEFDLAGAKRVAVVGNGNVAMDVTRILLQDPDALAETDIADYALAALRESNVEEVVLLGRRGPAQAAFSPKEIQEIANLEGAWLAVLQDDAELDPVSAAWLENAPRSAKRNVEFLQKQASEPAPSGARRTCLCRFCVSPVSFHGDDRLQKIRIQHAELKPDDRGVPRPHGIDEFEDLEVDLVFKAIGYRGVPIAGLSFDEQKGVIPNDGGRVLDAAAGRVVPGRYVVGWAKRGPTGLIGTNSPDSKATVQAMVEDLGTLDPDAAGGGDVAELLRSRSVDFVTFADWQRLDAWEVAEGEKRGKVRHKIWDIDEAMKVVRSLRAKTGEGVA